MVTFDPSTAGSSVVQVNIVEDEVVEEREVFRARLRVPSDQSGVVLGQEDITVTIVEDDGKFLRTSLSIDHDQLQFNYKR